MLWQRIFVVCVLVVGGGCSRPRVAVVVATADPFAETLAALGDVRPWRRLDAVSALRQELREVRERGELAPNFEVRVLDEATQSYTRYQDVFVLQLIAELRRPDSWRLMLRALERRSTLDVGLEWFEHSEVPLAERPVVARRILELAVPDDRIGFDENSGYTTRVMRALGFIGGVHVRDALVQVITDDERHSDVRGAAIVELGRRAEPESLQVLVDAIITNEQHDGAAIGMDTTWDVASGLWAYGPRTFELVLDVWEGRNRSTLSRARDRLPSSFGEHPETFARRQLTLACIRLLAEMGDPRALDPILVSLESENRMVNREAALAVGRLGYLDRDRSWRAVAALVQRRYGGENPRMDEDHASLVGVISQLAHPDSIPFLLERASVSVEFWQSVELPLLDCLLFMTVADLPLLVAWLERDDAPVLPIVRQYIEDVLPLMRRCGEHPDCYLDWALAILGRSADEPVCIIQLETLQRETLQLRKALVMLRRFGSERHANALLPWIEIPLDRRELLRTVEWLGGDTVIAFLGEQDDEELLRLHHRMALRRSVLGQ